MLFKGVEIVWKKNSRGKWAWFDGELQVSGASENESDIDNPDTASSIKLPPPQESAEQAPVYETHYSDYSKSLAKNYSVEQLEKSLEEIEYGLKKATAQHLHAIQRTTSMQSQSQARAQSRNVVSSLSQEKSSYVNALDICKKYPQHAKAEK